MRIMHVISGDLWAGAEVQVYNTLVALAKEQNVEILCIIFNKAILFDKLTKQAIPCFIIDETKISSLWMLKHLIKIIQEFQPDVIHAHRNKEHFLSFLSVRLVYKKIPVVRTVHGLSKFPDSLPLLRRLRSAIIFGIDMLLIKFMTRAIIAVSYDLRNHLSLIRPNGKIVLLNNSVDINYIRSHSEILNSREKYEIDQCFWIGTAVRFVGVKNIPMLIRSGKKLLQEGLFFRISVFGSGPLEKEYNSLTNSLELQKQVSIHPFEENIYPVIRSLDVFVLCSHHEGMPMSLLEAMALERPVVCTEVGGMKEIILDGINGLLVPDNDHDALANAIKSIYKDKKLAQKLGTNAGETVRKSYSITQTTKQLLSLYSSLIQ